MLPVAKLCQSNVLLLCSWPRITYGSVRENLTPRCSLSSSWRAVFGSGKEKPEELTEDSKQLNGELSMQYDETPPSPPQKHYLPPANISQTILTMARKISNDNTMSFDAALTDNVLKYKILMACISEFNFQIPSYELAELKTLSDVVQYYSLAREPICEEEKLMNSDLPNNLHLQLEPLRFTEESKHYFGNKTAFPQRDTVVTSLKFRNIYKGYENPKVYSKKKGFNYY